MCTQCSLGSNEANRERTDDIYLDEEGQAMRELSPSQGLGPQECASWASFLGEVRN
jgi:hypothetical protein